MRLHRSGKVSHALAVAALLPAAGSLIELRETVETFSGFRTESRKVRLNLRKMRSRRFQSRQNLARGGSFKSGVRNLFANAGHSTFMFLKYGRQ